MKLIGPNEWKPWAVALSIATVLLCSSHGASAMTFHVVTMHSEPAILGRGEIIAGDAGRLRDVLTAKAKTSWGYYTLVLEGPGGNVQAAFELSKVIDSTDVNTYVAPGGRCVSACAAIVFIAGREHIVAPGGYLGFHGCYNQQTKNIVNMCNDAIAQNAIMHGTAYGAVMGFIQNTPYNRVVWISSQDADCWGINRYVVSPKPTNYLQCVVDVLRQAQKH